jgi:hypothetical protein
MSQADFYKDLIANMATVPGITDLVGTRVHVERFPPGATLPNITLDTFDAYDNPSLAEAADIAFIEIAFSGWSTTTLQAREIRDAIYTQYSNFKGDLVTGRTRIQATLFIADSPGQQAPDAELFRCVPRVQFWYILGAGFGDGVLLEDGGYLLLE